LLVVVAVAVQAVARLRVRPVVVLAAIFATWLVNNRVVRLVRIHRFLFKLTQFCLWLLVREVAVLAVLGMLGRVLLVFLVVFVPLAGVRDSRQTPLRNSAELVGQGRADKHEALVALWPGLQGFLGKGLLAETQAALFLAVAVAVLVVLVPITIQLPVVLPVVLVFLLQLPVQQFFAVAVVAVVEAQQAVLAEMVAVALVAVAKAMVLRQRLTLVVVAVAVLLLVV
jgi:hypothetical protein